MSISPTYRSLDRMSAYELTDLFPARASSIPLMQHALMSGFGGPPQGRSCYIAATSGTPVTRVVSVRVPPGVKEVGIAALISGHGVVAFTSAEDSNGTELRSSATYSDSPLDVAAWLFTGYNGDTATSGGRSLPVRGSVLWEHSWVDVTVEVTPDSGQDLTLFSLVYYPVQVPR